MNQSERERLESRIESLVGEREELREALAKIDRMVPKVFDGMHLEDCDYVEPLVSIGGIAAAVLSSRETTDPHVGPIVLGAAASRRLDDIIASPSGELPDPPSRETAPRDVETTDSPKEGA